MTLVQATLEAGLATFMDPSSATFQGFPLSAELAAAAWATAYDTYARVATDASGDAILSVSKAGFQAALSFGLRDALLTPDPTPAKELATAWAAYWTGGTFAVGQLLDIATEPCLSLGGNGIWSVENSAVVDLANSDFLEIDLLTILAVPSSDAPSKISDIAAAFHKATTEDVTVLISGLDTTPTPTGPLPITNTCIIL